jgi:hypothetical protein
MAETRIVNIENVPMVENGDGRAFVAKIGRAWSDQLVWVARLPSFRRGSAPIHSTGTT